jgi:hypothetical protein
MFYGALGLHFFIPGMHKHLNGIQPNGVQLAGAVDADKQGHWLDAGSVGNGRLGHTEGSAVAEGRQDEL